MKRSKCMAGNPVVSTFQPFSGNEEMLFQVADMFPIPIEVFRPDGFVAFANRAWLQIHNISNPSDIIGKYNVRENPGLGPYVSRMFEGEIVLTPEFKVLLEDSAAWYQVRRFDCRIQSAYMEILCFPVLTPGGNASHLIAVFLPTRIYKGNRCIEKAKEYMDNHWAERYDTRTVAGAANLSPYYFVRLFKKHTGMTPYKYHRNVRVNKLKSLLCDKNLSVSEAFSACGMEYSGSFAKIFKDVPGLTPSAYRNLAGQPPADGRQGY